VDPTDDIAVLHRDIDNLGVAAVQSGKAPLQDIGRHRVTQLSGQNRNPIDIAGGHGPNLHPAAILRNQPLLISHA
jgi:hypothetical protein